MWENINWKEKRLEIKIIKTSESFNIMMTDAAIEILSAMRCIKEKDAYVFKRISNQALNRSIKIIIRMLNLRKRRKLYF